MELSWCRSFVAVVEHGGFLAAARVIHRSQSRISAHVAALEHEAGARLLDRDVHPPTLTAAGRAFLPHARAAIAEWQAALASASWTTGRIHGSVALGSIPSVSARLLAPACAAFAQQHPEVTFEIHEGPNSWLDDALAHRTVEVAIRPMFEHVPPVGVERRELLDDPFVLVVPDDHPLASHRDASFADLEGSALITTGEAGLDPHVGAEFREMLADVPIDRRRSLAVTQPTTVFALVRAGMGIGMVGALAASMIERGSLVVLPLAEKEARRRIGMYWAKTRPLSPVASEFMRAVEAQAQGLDLRTPTVRR